MKIVLEFLAVPLLTFYLSPKVAMTISTGPQAVQGTKSISMRKLLASVARKCNCSFTVEEISGDSFEDALENWLVPESLTNSPPQDAMERLVKLVPNLGYELDRTNSKIVHVVDARLKRLKSYPLDKTMDWFEFHGPLCGLVSAIAEKNTGISPHALYYLGDPSDSPDCGTQVHVRGKSLTVWSALSDFIPFNPNGPGKILWIAQTRVNGTKAETTIKTLF